MQRGAERGGEGGDGCQGTTPRSGGTGDYSGTGNSRIREAHGAMSDSTTPNPVESWKHDDVFYCSFIQKQKLK